MEWTWEFSILADLFVGRIKVDVGGTFLLFLVLGV